MPEAGWSKPMSPSQSPGSSIEVRPEPLDGPAATHLARRLIEELDRRYSLAVRVLPTMAEETGAGHPDGWSPEGSGTE
jgi:hypothetical protein